MASLQEQLLKAGVVDEKKAKQIKKDKRKKAKQTPKGQSIKDEAKELAKQVLLEKAQRDREINLEQQKLVEKKAVAAQIKQLIETNRIDRRDGDIAYQFTDGKKIKKLFVTTLLQNQLSRGLIAIVKLADGYELVPSAVAEKIAQRDDRLVLLKNQPADEIIDEDDPYADYKIPDDLMW